MNGHGRLSVAAWAALALLASLSLWFYATGGRVAYTMDSLTYRDAAVNFLAGHSLTASNVHSETPERVPLLQWPPSYPALWAVATFASAADIDRVPSILTPLLLGITVLSMFWAVALLTGRPAIACLLATVGAFTPSSMAVFGHARSETLFLPCVLLAFGALWKYKAAAGPAQQLGWLAMAAICVGLANWTRYTGVLFLPLLALSVVAVSGGPPLRRFVHASLTLLAALALVAPLWLRNYNLTGSLSGSDRGGMARHVADRLLGDLAAMVELLEHALFNFDMLLRAHLEVPAVAVAAYALIRAVRRYGCTPLPSAVAWTPLVWAVANLLFLLYARIFQRDVDLDYRMLAVAVPFVFLGFAPLIASAFSCRSDGWGMGLVVLVLALLVNTGLQEGRRVHENYAANKAPAWRARFAIVYRDLTLASSTARALKATIAELTASTLVLTDYRALWVRYLTGARAYAVSDAVSCTQWLRTHEEGVLLSGYPADAPSWASNPWAPECMRANPRWRLIRVSGNAAHSLILHE